MMNDEFENRLRRQPPREIPSHWRAEILAVQSSPRIVRRWFLPSSIFHLASPILRWSALAAVWVVILALNHTARDTSPVVTARSSPPSQQMILAVREQRKLFAELVEPQRELPVANRPKPNQPHSQRRDGLQGSC